MATAVKSTKDETPVARAARELSERIAVDADAMLSETREARETREAEEAEQLAVLTQLGRIEEVRTSLARGSENWTQVRDQAVTRLQAMVGPSVDPEVRKAAQKVADTFDVALSPAGLKQPPAPKGRSPFDDGK